MRAVFPSFSLKMLLVFTSAMSALVAVSSNAEVEGQWRGGENVYEKVCAHCHENGRVGPELKGRQLPAVYISAIVRSGFLAMPAFPASHIDDASLRSVGEYLQFSRNENKASGEVR